uniref:Uncharacterized protein n=1 Tax=Anopheles culicifacies TaxID=139723 RepID=A0A182LZ32_9DIPT
MYRFAASICIDTEVLRSYRFDPSWKALGKRCKDATDKDAYWHCFCCFAAAVTGSVMESFFTRKEWFGAHRSNPITIRIPEVIDMGICTCMYGSEKEFCLTYSLQKVIPSERIRMAISTTQPWSGSWLEN